MSKRGTLFKKSIEVCENKTGEFLKSLNIRRRYQDRKYEDVL
jgi:hypothetical protein